MAKIKFTAIVSEIRGKIRGDVIKGVKDGFVIQDIARIPMRKSEGQMVTRMSVSHFASLWSTLDPDIQTLWETYGASMTPPRAGQWVYIACNVALMTARHPALTPITLPPVDPGIPAVPAIVEVVGLTSLFVPSTPPAVPDYLWLFWNLPADDEVYIKTWYSYLISSRAVGRERWNWLQTVESKHQSELYKRDVFIEYTRRFKLQAVDKYGRVSAYSKAEYDKTKSYLLLDTCDSSVGWKGAPLDPPSEYEFGIQGTACLQQLVAVPGADSYMEVTIDPPYKNLSDKNHLLVHVWTDQWPDIPPTEIAYVKLTDSAGKEMYWWVQFVKDRWQLLDLNLDAPDYEEVGFHRSTIEKLKINTTTDWIPAQLIWRIDFIYATS
jgi:hypothetical protein